jgi:hypothetical protein
MLAGVASDLGAREVGRNRCIPWWKDEMILEITLIFEAGPI